ncbi:hypothetical protein [Amycolatopsis sp. NPDC054798]
MTEYHWPEGFEGLMDRASAAWTVTCEMLPIGSPVRGKVIGRQPFGVLLRIEDVADAIGLTETVVIPQGKPLPALGDTVVGEVIGHAAHNCQIRIRPRS